MALDTLGWGRPETRDEVNFVLESRLFYGVSNGGSHPAESPGDPPKMTKVGAVLATLGGGPFSPRELVAAAASKSLLQFPPHPDKAARQAVLLLFKEKNGRNVLARVRNLTFRRKGQAG